MKTADKYVVVYLNDSRPQPIQIDYIGDSGNDFFTLKEAKEYVGWLVGKHGYQSCEIKIYKLTEVAQ